MRSLLTMKLIGLGFTLLMLAGFAETSASHVKITIDHNTGREATSAFKFKNVPSPVKDNAASGANLKLVLGIADPNSEGLKALTDGVLPENDDDPSSNFFFGAGSDGGRFLMDLGAPIEIAQINTYSWHRDTRGPQVYNLFASDGTDPRFNPAPDSHTDPATCGWKLIATVDTHPSHGESGGQYGVSITDATGSVGKFRYLLFDSIPTEYDDSWGNTFFSEVNVIGKAAMTTSVSRHLLGRAKSVIQRPHRARFPCFAGCRICQNADSLIVGPFLSLGICCHITPLATHVHT